MESEKQSLIEHFYWELFHHFLTHAHTHTDTHTHQWGCCHARCCWTLLEILLSDFA